MRGWYINFRDKGENPQAGGFFFVDNTEERDEWTRRLKEAGLKVVWEATDG